MTLDQQKAGEIHIDIVEKPVGKPWRIIGDGPESLLGQSGLLVSKERGAFEVRNSGTDEVLGRGSTLANAAEDLSLKTGLRVVLFDETANKELGRFGGRSK